MAIEQTLSFFKPDGMLYQVPVIDKIKSSGFEIINQNVVQISKEFAKEFYGHVEKINPNIYFDLWNNYITSGPVRIMVLQRDNAVQIMRTLTGITDPEYAAEGTIRRMYGTDKKRIADIEQRATRNILHCSASLFEAKDEIVAFYAAGYLV
jgi:nucleoside-diphosphate kinase